MVATHNRPLHQLDIKNVFLHDDLLEEVYIEQLLSFIDEGEYRKVRHLHKSLYSLKESPRAWLFNQPIKKFEMKKYKSNYSVFYRQSTVDIILLVVYADDIGNDIVSILSLKSLLHSQFHTKD